MIPHCHRIAAETISFGIGSITRTMVAANDDAGMTPFDLCANLTFHDESTDS